MYQYPILFSHTTLTFQIHDLKLTYYFLIKIIQ